MNGKDACSTASVCRSIREFRQFVCGVYTVPISNFEFSSPPHSIFYFQWPTWLLHQLHAGLLMSLQLIVLPILCCFFRRSFCRRLIEWNQIIRQAVDTVWSCDFMQQNSLRWISWTRKSFYSKCIPLHIIIVIVVIAMWEHSIDSVIILSAISYS